MFLSWERDAKGAKSKENGSIKTSYITGDWPIFTSPLSLGFWKTSVRDQSRAERPKIGLSATVGDVDRRGIRRRVAQGERAE